MAHLDLTQTAGGGGSAAPRLRVTSTPEGDDLVLAVEGDVDLATADTMTSWIERGAADSVRAVVIDLSNVPFLDSSGVAALVSAHGSLAAANRALIIRNPRPAVQQVFSLVGLDQVLDIQLS